MQQREVACVVMCRAVSCSSWLDCYEAKLPKMFIKCNGFGDSQVLHHGIARTIGETPMLIVEASKNLPGGVSVL